MKQECWLAGIAIAESDTRIEAIRQLSIEEVTTIKESITKLFEFEASYALFKICSCNYEEMVSFWKKIEREHVGREKESSITSRDEIETQMHRLLMNYLSSFRSFLDHFDGKLGRLKLETDYLSIFKAKKKHYYDSTFSYRFLYRLRNHVQHYGLPDINFKINLSAPSVDGTNSYQFSNYFERDKLLNPKYSKWSTVKKDIENQPEKMGVIFHASVLDLCIRDLNKICVRADLEVIEPHWRILVNIFSETQCFNPALKPIIAIPQKDDKELHQREDGLERMSLIIQDIPTSAMRLVESCINSLN